MILSTLRLTINDAQMQGQSETDLQEWDSKCQDERNIFKIKEIELNCLAARVFFLGKPGFFMATFQL